MRKRNKSGRKALCCKCGEPKERPEQGYCNSCKAEWERNNRKKHSQLPEKARLRANARAYLRVYIKLGKVSKGPCCICGTYDNLEAHHDDYTKPLEVRWYCREHHVEHHKKIN